MTRVVALSRTEAEGIIPGNISCAVISISNPNRGGRFSNKFIRSILPLSFHDVEVITDTPSGRFFPMTENDAKRVAVFVNAIWDKIDYLIVHCEAGISRSSGVAAAILKAKTGDDSEIFENVRYVPNRTCYRKVIKAFGLDYMQLAYTAIEKNVGYDSSGGSGKLSYEMNWGEVWDERFGAD